LKKPNLLLLDEPVRPRALKWGSSFAKQIAFQIRCCLWIAMPVWKADCPSDVTYPLSRFPRSDPSAIAFTADQPLGY